ncbi:MAG: zinc ABC transporter substrate-binding protein [Lachnospiraceae bacterium]|nr:zinc ABC transporter substrate-binding protein [Clostridiales bacterium]MBP3755178.1 zinc ABC transporter substrate-binding protein [Lachnospiraceae bacterium]
MKKMLTKIAAVLCAAVMLTACAGQGSGSAPSSGSDKLSIVTTIFPEYDWVMQILGDKAGDAEVTMLLDNGVDLHSYQPVASDILKISDCDIFIYVGGESDGWVDDALKESVNPDMIVINLLEVLGDDVKEEEVVEGMQEEDEHDHDHHDEDGDHDEDEDHDHDHEEEEVEYDEHVWLSLRNASVLCDAITDGLAKADPDNASVYQANNDAYKAQLSALDEQYKEAVAGAAFDTVLFGDRFPFRYLTDDYNLDYYAAFVGCSAETEASFETVVFLANKIDELGLGAILTIENSDGKIAQTIRDNTADKNQEIYALDSMQATTSADVKNGVTYLSVMTSNLEVLKQALN